MDEKDWPNWSYNCKAKSGQYLDGPGRVKKMTLTADGTNPASVSFYDGHTTAGQHKITLRAPKNTSVEIEYEIPFWVVQGLYAELSANIECVSVQYRKEKP